MLPACPPCCHFECREHFGDDHPEVILSIYWSLSFSESRQWLDSNLKLCPIMRRTSGDSVPNDTKRKCSLIYTLPKNDGEVKKVCKKMFLSSMKDLSMKDP